MSHVQIVVVASLSLLATMALAGTDPATSPKAIATQCAAANIVLSSRMDDGILKDVITAEARRHYEMAQNLGATQSDLEQFATAMVAGYNSGDISWAEIADIGEMCTEIGGR